ncbi:MAG: hypothetical protein HC822_02105 [Oscillochloris sp.]|nr:hypothetical protein [Oscillochloris sp.]
MKHVAFPRLVPVIFLTAVLLAGLGLGGSVRAAPLDPPWSQGLVRVDALAALWIAFTAAIAFAELATDRSWRRIFSVALLGFAYLTTHFALLGALLALATLIAGRHWAARLSGLLAAAGLALIGAQADSWRYPSPTIGLGLNSISLLLLIGAVVLAIWWPQQARQSDRSAAPFTPQPDGLLSVALLYGLMRLFVLGPWNLGWLFAMQLLGAAGALWASWRAARSPDPLAQPWLSAYLLSLALAGVGLSSAPALDWWSSPSWPCSRFS